MMSRKAPPDGLYPIYINPSNGNFANNKITFGAMGDSFYEYMLKCWLQLGQKDDYLRKMFDDSMDGVSKKLHQKSTPTGLSYIADLNGGQLDHKMDHLVCFMGGNIARPSEKPSRANKGRQYAAKPIYLPYFVSLCICRLFLSTVFFSRSKSV